MALLEDPDPKFKQKQIAFWIISSAIIVLAIVMLWWSWNYIIPTEADSAGSQDNQTEQQQSSATENSTTYNDPQGRFSFQYDSINTDLQPENIIRETDLGSLTSQAASPNEFSASFLEQEKSALASVNQAALENLYGVGQNAALEQVRLELREHTDGNGMLVKRYLGEDPGYEFSYVFYTGNARLEIFKTVSLLDAKYIEGNLINIIKSGSQQERVKKWQTLVDSDTGATNTLSELENAYQAIISSLTQ